jgi:hypothetical protein
MHKKLKQMDKDLLKKQPSIKQMHLKIFLFNFPIFKIQLKNKLLQKWLRELICYKEEKNY